MADRSLEFQRHEEKLAYGLGRSFAQRVASTLPITEIIERGTSATVLRPADIAYAEITGSDPLRHLGTVHFFGAGDAINEILDAHPGESHV